MASIGNTQPTNQNFLSPTGFLFSIRKLPNVDYFLQSVIVPGVRLNAVSNPIKTPFAHLVTPGDHMTFDPLVITFKIDEAMESWTELFDWIEELGRPVSSDDYAALANNSPVTGNTPLVDATLTILSSHYQPTIRLEFFDLIPQSLSGIQMASAVGDINFLTATATFEYRSYSYSTP
jgi:hypothetical protein